MNNLVYAMYALIFIIKSKNVDEISNDFSVTIKGERKKTVTVYNILVILPTIN